MASNEEFIKKLMEDHNPVREFLGDAFDWCGKAFGVVLALVLGGFVLWGGWVVGCMIFR